MKKAVIFDLDGTLINSLPDIANAMNKVLLSFGLTPHEEEKYKLFTGDGAKNLTLRALGQNPEMFESVYPIYCREYGLNSRIHTAPYPGVSELLHVLSDFGLQLCVLSNKGDADVKNVVQHYFPQLHFDYIGGVREGGPVKPDPQMALEVLKVLGIPAEDVWYVGDTATDMRCAENAGIDSIGVGWGFQSRKMIMQANPKFFAESVAELQELILNNLQNA